MSGLSGFDFLLIGVIVWLKVVLLVFFGLSNSFVVIDNKLGESVVAADESVVERKILDLSFTIDFIFALYCLIDTASTQLSPQFTI